MILIRADANEIIGAGHIMRCLAIAKAFESYGEKALFVTADHKADHLISENGFESVCINERWDKMDARSTLVLVNKHHPNLLIVDSYYVSEQYLKSLRRAARVAYVDDLNRQKWDVDYLINYNIYSNNYDYSYYDDGDTHLLIGCNYVPLRNEFSNLPRHRIGDVSNVMISTGGSDPENITEWLMETLCKTWDDICFHIVLGALNPRLNEIMGKALTYDNVVLHVNERNMASLMLKCDIAVSASGSTLYELCACGTPTITYTLADNQKNAAETFEAKGIMLNAGDCRENSRFTEIIGDSIFTLISNRNKREEMSKRMKMVVDGKGAHRIARQLMRI